MKTSDSQLRVVIVLLVAAVVLPTVCLLWFASQAVKNERLAVKQKLIDSYEKRADTFFIEYPNGFWKGVFDGLSSAGNVLKDHPVENFADMITAGHRMYCGVVVYDADGRVVWPAEGSFDEGADYGLLEKAGRLEFVEGDYSGALAEYERAVSESSGHETRYAGSFGMIRCLRELGRNDEAVEAAFRLAYPLNVENMDVQKGVDVLKAKVLLGRLYMDKPDEELYRHLRRSLTGGRFNDEKVSGAVIAAADAEIWALQEFIETAQDCMFSGRLKREIEVARQKVDVRMVSLEVGRVYKDYEKVLPLETVHRLETEQQLYGFVTSNAGYNILMVIPGEYMTDYFLTPAFNDFNDEIAYCNIYDDSGALLLGENEQDSKPFMKVRLGQYLQGFSAGLFFNDGGVFESAASRQTALYTWSAVLIILFILLAGSLAVGSVSRQVKVNKLKNDFLATVTHELKTPVASTRVLVETLLDRNLDETQRREYLGMISSENSRLSRLIDNFLTFSRMERNKHWAFDKTYTEAGDVAKAAENAVRPHFDDKICRFYVTIEDVSASIMVDRDALTTAVVNLLENAYKYSGEQKEIELRVYSEAGYVCFAVMDNGPGIPRRAHRKIFERFYQLDTSLSRKTQGAGLGLAIVKFIADAHEAEIELVSKPQQGSTFILKVPKIN